MPKPRSKPNKKLQKTMRIFCEGAKTEPFYIEGFIASRKFNTSVAVVKIEPTRKNTPKQLVEEAVSLKRSDKYIEGDEIWVAYDRESTAKYSHKDHAEAFEKARAAGIKIALTNVCFEYWLLLHMINTGTAYSSYDDLYTNSPLCREFENRFSKRYSKAGRDVFNILSAGLQSAAERAISINRSGVEAAADGSRPFEINPYTNFYELLCAISGFFGQPLFSPPINPEPSKGILFRVYS